MVRLTRDMIVRGTSGYIKKRRDETSDQFLNRLTHLYLENKGLKEIGDELSLCSSLIVLYLYDNCLSKIPLLNQGSTLTHVYLQNNLITRISGLGNLNRLTKLYLGGNCITVVEGMETLKQLQELHLEHQKLPSGEKLLFDPRTINSLSGSLQILNISGNHIDHVLDLKPLNQLTQFLVGDNDLSDLRELLLCVQTWPFLWRLEIAGNPVTQKSKCRDKLILSVPRLEMLDGKPITEQARNFVQNWEASKQASRQKNAYNNNAALLYNNGNVNSNLPTSAPHPVGSFSTYDVLGPPGHSSYVTQMPARKRVRNFLARSKSMQPAHANVSHQPSFPLDMIRSSHHLNSHTYNAQLLDGSMGMTVMPSQFSNIGNEFMRTLPSANA